MTTRLLDDYVESENGDWFEVLLNRGYTLEEATEFFRREYEFFRGELIDSSIIKEANGGTGVLYEGRIGQISILPSEGFSSSESFRIVAWNAVGNNGRHKRFYDSLQRRFE